MDRATLKVIVVAVAGVGALYFLGRSVAKKIVAARTKPIREGNVILPQYTSRMPGFQTTSLNRLRSM